MEYLSKAIATILIGIVLFMGEYAVETLFFEKTTRAIQKEVIKEIKKPWGNPDCFFDWEYDWERY
jgi:hypothetical protein